MLGELVNPFPSLLRVQSFAMLRRAIIRKRKLALIICQVLNSVFLLILEFELLSSRGRLRLRSGHVNRDCAGNYSQIFLAELA